MASLTICDWDNVYISHMTDMQTLEEALATKGYIADRAVVTSLYMSLMLHKPMLIEGPAGVGKTEIAKVLAAIYETELIRLQCYEGLEVHHALYEWHYQRQLLHLKMVEQKGLAVDEMEHEIYSDRFLIKRPLLRAIDSERPVVLLIDEVDRADEEFESFLLELLSDWQITIPEVGTVVARSKPYVILTGNRTRELSEALRRRCIYMWIDYPTFEKEVAIVQSKLPDINEQLARQICLWMQELREMRLEKTPGIAETLDWAQALVSMHFDHLDKDVIQDTLGIILKDWADMRKVSDALSDLLEKTGVKLRLE